MINFVPLQTPVSTPKVNSKPSPNATTAGVEINKDAQHGTQQVFQGYSKKRRGKDRRQRNLKPLIDMRSNKERRDDPQMPSIDIEV